MFGWLRKFRRAPLQPESQWLITIDDDAIRATDQTGAVATLAKRDLQCVLIETNDSGPWGIDLWWLLFGPDGALGCTVPGGATGEGELVTYVMGLPGFDHGEMGKATASTDNALFKLWERSD